MTIEERVLTALRRGKPDCVPVFIYLNPYSGYAWYTADPTYRQVLEVAIEYADVIHDWGFPSGFFHSAAELEREKRELGNGHVEHIIHTPKGELSSITRDDWRGGGSIKRWVCEPGDVSRLLSIPYKAARPDLAPFHRARAEAEGRWITQVTFADPICAAGYVDEMAMALWTVERRDLLRELLDTAFERIRAELEYCLDNGVGPVYYFNGPEYALPPLMSPDDFEEFVVAYDRELVSLVHQYPGNYVIVHSHGKVGRFLERFAEIGMDGLNVLEPPPIGDTILADAKRRIGEEVCLIGNIQYDDIARGSEEEIEKLVIDAVRDGGLGGGFILSPCASPYERPLPGRASRNLIHYMKMGRKHGRYSS